jgi:disulfide bond formation protein DsbB
MHDSSSVGAAASNGFDWRSRRMLNGVGFLICLGGLGFALYVQYGIGLEPCPLCIFQRLALLALGLVFLVAALHDPRGWGAKVYGVLLGLTATVGASVAIRHVWLQNLPPEEVPLCGPGLDYMLETLPLAEAIREVLSGSGECAEIDWTLLGLSMPWWTLLLFLGLGVLGELGNWRIRR